MPVHIVNLDGLDPLLYAAKKAIGPLQLSEEEARDTSRRAYENNLRLTSFEIGQAIGRSRQTVDIYISDLRAVTETEIDIKIFRMHRLYIPQERMAHRLGVLQQTISLHLQKMPELAKLVNIDLSKGFTVPQVAEKHACPACPVGPEDRTWVGPEDLSAVSLVDRTGGWPEPLVWSIALEGKNDIQRFKSFNRGLRTWDL